MALTKYVVEKPPNKELARYLDAELRKIQRALDSVQAWRVELEEAAAADTESGTFTPIIAGTGVPGSHGYLLQLGQFLRRGKLVHVDVTVFLNAKDAAMTGNVNIIGFPFVARAGASANDFAGIAVVQHNQITLTAGKTLLTARIPPSGSGVQLVENGSAADGAFIPASAFNSNSGLILSGTYIAE